jgi:hypothetical protein
MARIRSIKPEFWTSEQVMECSLNARLLFIGLWNFADDLGRLSLAPKTIKAQIFPGDEMSSETILGMVQELSDNALVLLYTVEGKNYIQITGWQHQRIDKPQPGKHPAPTNGYSKTVLGMVATDRIGEEGKGEERNSEPSGSGAPAPIDHRKRLFDEGLKKLAAMTGKGPDACRSFVGKCLSAAADDAVTVLGLIEDAERNQIANPSAWISARLKPTGPPGKPNTAFRQGQSVMKEIRDELGQFALSTSGKSSRTDLGLLPRDSSERPEGLRSGPGANVIDLPAGDYRASR